MEILSDSYVALYGSITNIDSGVIGFNVSSFDETRISEFNQLSARGFDHALFKVYNFANSGPLLEFKAE